ncbi:STAS domain-containing protein [Streptomyces sp. NPDC005930]|uniref:STAS domain-containing protein n=1 Tax=Streptomyces sp. NPDC005930 TaxID=3364736 RepID=UPI0036AE4DE1
MQVTHEARGAVIALRGELDFESVVQLEEAGATELARGRNAGPVVVDCAALSFCDSSGVGALLRLFQELAAQQRVLRLGAVPHSVVRLFTQTGLDQVFAVHKDVDEALTAGTQQRDGVAAHVDEPARPKGRQVI